MDGTSNEYLLLRGKLGLCLDVLYVYCTVLVLCLNERKPSELEPNLLKKRWLEVGEPLLTVSPGTE